ncbi:hypothetical protein [Microlunatus speluncae]|uniref:hypothetical protein n=1 Tax=Microlunatus speluncae TaxID=2594267 RepID=UPI00126683B1|nr:hypothetical protein [Microlunatus speluncae]
MELRPRISIRDSLAARGLILGAGVGLGAALCYLLVLVPIVLILGPAVDAVAAGQPVIMAGFDGDLILPAAVITALVVGFVAGVLPASVAGGIAGFGIGFVLQLTIHRRRPARSSDHAPPGRADPADRQPGWPAWLIGTAVSLFVGAAAAFVATLTVPGELVWSSSGLMILWLPVLIFAVAGGPFARLLPQRADRKRLAETPVRPRRAAN